METKNEHVCLSLCMCVGMCMVKAVNVSTIVFSIFQVPKEKHLTVVDREK